MKKYENWTTVRLYGVSDLFMSHSKGKVDANHRSSNISRINGKLR